MVGGFERSRAGGRKGGGKPASPLRADARQAACGLGSAILLIGGNKTGKGRWYKEFVPIADRLYDEHLETVRREGLFNG